MGSAKFIKSALNFQKHIELSKTEAYNGSGKAVVLPGLSFSFGSTISTVLPYGSRSSDQISLSDRLYSGNSLFLRGFGHNAIGPRFPSLPSDDISSLRNVFGDKCGGLFKHNAVLVASVPVPIASLAVNGSRAFAFCGYGSVSSPQLLKGKTLSQIYESSCRSGAALSLFRDILRETRVSIGCGFSVPIGPARIELTYAVPLLKSETDVIKQFQIGLGISIL